MVRVGTVWDSAVEAVRGRLGPLLPIAVATLFVPSVIQSAVQAYYPAVPGDAGRAGLSLLVTLALMVLGFWGALAITAITSDPDVTRADAVRAATARFPALLGVFVVMVLAATLLTLPVFVLIGASGADLSSLGQQGATPDIGGGTALALFLYILVALGLFLWVVARLLPLTPVVLHERLGLRAIGRAFSLTRGMGVRLV
ncbi:MAG TPA: hypothetical protein VF636_01610, partial [Sphingomonas sp.]